MGKLQVIEVSVTQNKDWFIASSKDLHGLFGAHPDMTALLGDLPNMIKTMYKVKLGMDVEVTQAGSVDKQNPFPIRYVTQEKRAA